MEKVLCTVLTEDDDTCLKKQQEEEKGSECFASGGIAADRTALCWSWNSKPGSCW